MPGIVRSFDVNLAGGAATIGDTTFIVNNRPTVRSGSPVTPHVPCPKVPIHCSAVTGIGIPTFIVSGLPANCQGNVDSCGHLRVSGSGDFIIGI
jgi:uncharacterized Zn-binding protein involved in type VI secretion